MNIANSIQGASGRTWLRRAGFAGFLVFFVKGLVWLAALAVWFYLQFEP